MKTALGVDLGGTWLRAEAVGWGGKSLGRWRVPAIPWRFLPRILPGLPGLRRLRPLHRLTVGAAGLWSAREKIQARRLLRGLAASVQVLSDLELGQAAAFAGGSGVLVVGGTGSGAYAVDEQGRRARAGGLGALLGDEGSGFWLGRAALRDETLRRRMKLDPLVFAHAPNPTRAVAALAARLLRLAAPPSGPEAARALRRQAAEHLADCACRAASGLRFSGTVPVSWTGGLFRDEGFRRCFQQALRRRPIKFEPAPPLLKPERAAAVLNFYDPVFCRMTP